MAQTPEKKVKDKVVKLIKAYGIYYFFPATFTVGENMKLTRHLFPLLF